MGNIKYIRKKEAFQSWGERNAREWNIFLMLCESLSRIFHQNDFNFSFFDCVRNLKRERISKIFLHLEFLIPPPPLLGRKRLGKTTGKMWWGKFSLRALISRSVQHFFAAFSHHRHQTLRRSIYRTPDRR